MSDHPSPGELSDYVDSELTNSRAADVERHVSACTSCSDWVKAHQAIASAIEALPPVTVPDDFSARVMERLAPYRLLHRLTIAASVAFALLTLTIGTALIGWGLIMDASVSSRLGASAAASIARALSVVRSAAMVGRAAIDVVGLLMSSGASVLRYLWPVLPVLLLLAVAALTYLLQRNIDAYRRRRFA